MIRSEWRITTARAARLLQQLCTHFAQRTAAVHTPVHGHIVFPAGSCRLEAGDDLLVMRVEAEDASGLVRLEALLAGQLERVVAAEPPEVWTGLEGLKF
jgi:hypothetical protein